jgi:hypothetical protein
MPERLDADTESELYADSLIELDANEGGRGT